MRMSPQHYLKDLLAGALVIEPGCLDFQIFRFVMFDICLLQNMLGKSGGGISRKNNKGVLDRP